MTDDDVPAMQHVILQPPPRWMTDEQLRAHFGLSDRSMRRLRLMRDFPRRNELLNRTDSKLVDRFFDHLSGIAPSLDYDHVEDGPEHWDDEAPARRRKSRF